MRIGVAKETATGECRVALVPEIVARLIKSGLEVAVETGAGAAASHPDADYQSAGARLAASAAEALQADLVAKVQRPSLAEAEQLRRGGALICFLQPAQDPQLLQRLVQREATVFSMDLIPRISRAQKMDALSSMSTVAGYKAVLLAAAALPRFFPLLMTAAGTIAPAKVLVLGGGVAGLQAIATARRLGAVVDAFDVRPKVKEEVQSLGAGFIGMPTDESLETAGGYAKEVAASFLDRERQVLRDPVRAADVVICTAMVPGKRAPVLVTADMAKAMKPGSVIVDIAADMGGNCEWTEPGREVVKGGVRVIGAVNLASTMPYHASQMYSRNVAALLGLLIKDGTLHLDWDDEITAAACVAHAGKSRLTPAVATAPASAAAAAP